MSSLKYIWLMNGKTVDNVNDALAPTSDITSANITYLREDYSINLGYAFYTEDNVIPLVDAELNYSIHIITRPGAIPRSEIVRVNTISQSPTVTTAGQGIKGFTEFINFSEQMSPLGNASAVACADYCISMFSDYTKYVTMQNLFHDGGFSNTGVTQQVIEKFGNE
mgnify:CR=1 FL=1